jgi:hypothetical protein
MKSCKNSEAKNNQQAYIFSPRTKEREKGTDIEQIQQIFHQFSIYSSPFQ